VRRLAQNAFLKFLARPAHFARPPRASNFENHYQLNMKMIINIKRKKKKKNREFLGSRFFW